MIKNCTQHNVDIVVDDTTITIPPCGIVPRCSQIEGIPVTVQVFGDVIDLPEQEADVFLIVSRLVASACPAREDLLIPGPLLRDEAGKVVGCKGLSKL